MRIREVMSPRVRVASPGQTLQEAAQIMEEIDSGVLPVGEDDRLVGMLTDRDIAIRAVARGLSPAECTVGDVMSPEIKYVYDDETVEDAARNMSDLQVRRLPVVNRKKRLVGIVTLGDIALNKVDSAGKALKGVSEPPPDAA